MPEAVTASLAPRRAAFSLLRRFDKQRPGRPPLKADALLQTVLHGEGTAWGPEDRGFFTALVYETLRWWLMLDALVAQSSDFPLARMSPEVRTLLRLGLVQLKKLDHVPDYAAIDTTVTLARELGLSKKSQGFINGVLRGVLRAETPEPCDEPLGDADALARLWSLPTWFAELLVASQGLEGAETTARLLKTPPPLGIRVNTLLTTPEAYAARLTEAGIAFVVLAPETCPESLVVSGFRGSPAALPGFAEGAVTVQDPSSAAVARLLAPLPGERVVDLCAAPGSKTTHLAALMNNHGTVHAVDPVPQRLALLAENLSRLGVTCVEVAEGPAEKFCLPAGVQADRVLVDAPCSGLGTARRHPEILLQVRPESFKAFAKKQQALLKTALALLKPGGRLVYSTCSLSPLENDAVLQAFLAAQPGLTLLSAEQRPIAEGSDGFYLAALERER